jgi:hypothetical protein
MKTRTMIRTAKAFQPRDGVFSIGSEREYALALRRLEPLVRQVGDDLADPRYGLIETLSLAIDAYDRKQSAVKKSSAA